MPIISVDPVTHNLMVIADKQTSEQIRAWSNNLDAAEPQVLIKVVFLEVQHNNSSEIGVQGSYTGGTWGTSLQSLTGFTTNYSVLNVLGQTVSGMTTNKTVTPTIVPTSITPTYQNNLNLGNSFDLPATVTGASGNGGLYQVLGNDFTATIQAIAAAGKSQVLSRPSILARDGQMAQIVVGQSIYLPSGVDLCLGRQLPPPPFRPSTAPTKTWASSWMSRPFIGANGLVEMILATAGHVRGHLLAGPDHRLWQQPLGLRAVYAPNIDITSANTVVVTPNGQTVVIGGLISNTKSTADSKVPFLGDIPILGQLFRASSKAQARTELLMFLTPHIVEAPSQLARHDQSGNRARLPLITNSISEQELDRFLERVPVKHRRTDSKKKK